MEYEGRVKFYDPNKAYGFISGSPDGDVFIHRSNLGPGRDELIEGQEVLFKVRSAPRGAEAYDVFVTKESTLPPRPRNASNDRPPRERGFGGGFGGDRFGGGERRGGRGGGGRFGDSRKPVDNARVPSGPVAGEVCSVDAQERFLFVKTDRDGLEIFVHSSHFARTGVRRGDRVSVTVEQGPKGLRATSFERD